MTENEAIELLGKLNNFMRVTNETLKTLVLRTENQQVDIDKIKKELNKNRIIMSN